MGIAGAGFGIQDARAGTMPQSAGTPTDVVGGLSWVVPTGLSATDPAATKAALQAAIDSFNGGPGIISVPASAPGSPWLFQDVIDFKNVDVRGCGGGFAQQATIFQATNAGAQFAFSGGGSQSQDFKIDGGNIATTPFSRYPTTAGTAGRVFRNILVTKNADDGTGVNPLCLFVGAQNDLYEMFHMTFAANDIACFDGGFGGATFVACQLSTAGRYHARFDTRLPSPTTYSCPADIQFEACRFEGSGGLSVIQINAGYNITFDGSDVYTTNALTGPMVNVVNGTQITYRNGALQQVGAATMQAGSTGFWVGGTSSLILEGRLSFTNLSTCVALDGSSSYLDDKSASAFARCGAHAAFTNGANATQAGGMLSNGLGIAMQGSQQPALTSYTAQRGALLYQMLATGQQKYYPGNGYTPDVMVGRSAPGVWGVSGAGYLLATGFGQRGAEGATFAGALYVDTGSGVVEVSDGTNWHGTAAYGTWHPSDNQLLACSFEPSTAKSSFLPLPSGAAAFMRLKVPAGASIKTVHVWVGEAGLTLTAASATIYDANGTQLGTTKDQSTAWSSTGKKPMPLVNPIAAQTHDHVVYVALYAAGKTLPKLAYNGGIAATDFGVSTGPYTCGRISRSTSTPTTVSLSSMQSYFCYLVGLA